MQTINKLLQAGFILRFQTDGDRVGVEVFNGETCIAFGTGKTLDEAVADCLVYVIIAQEATIRAMEAALDMAPESTKRFLRPGPDWGTEGL